jgi:hypothetical protein
MESLAQLAPRRYQHAYARSSFKNGKDGTMRNTLLIALSACAASACGSSGEREEAPPVQTQSEGQKALHALNDFNRAIALKRAIHASGIQCQRIDRSGYVAEYKKLSMWAANCNDGRSWALFVGPDDSVQVRSCKELEALKLPSCPAWTAEARKSR